MIGYRLQVDLQVMIITGVHGIFSWESFIVTAAQCHYYVQVYLSNILLRHVIISHDFHPIYICNQSTVMSKISTIVISSVEKGVSIQQANLRYTGLFGCKNVFFLFICINQLRLYSVCHGQCSLPVNLGISAYAYVKPFSSESANRQTHRHTHTHRQLRFYNLDR